MISNLHKLGYNGYDAVLQYHQSTAATVWQVTTHVTAKSFPSRAAAITWLKKLGMVQVADFGIVYFRKG